MSQRNRKTFADLVRRHNHALIWAATAKSKAVSVELHEFLRTHESDTKFLDLTFSADAPEIAALIFALQDRAIYRAGFDNSEYFPYSHFPLIQEPCNLRFLELLHTAGMPLKRFGYSFAMSAFNLDRSDYMKFAETIIGKRISLIFDLSSHVDIVLNCGPEMAPRVLIDMPALEADYIARSWSSSSKIMPLKTLAAWILVGHDFSRWMQIIHPDHRWIVQTSMSQHGRLKLHNLEPNLLEVLGRNARAPFFGVTDRFIPPPERPVMTTSAYNAFQNAVHARSEVCDVQHPPEAAAALEDGLLDLISLIPPSRNMLRQTLSSGNARLLDSLLQCHGSAPYCAIQSNLETHIPIAQLHAEGRVDLLRIMHKHGLPVIHQESTLRLTLLSQPRVEMLNFFLEELGQVDLLFPEYAVNATRLFAGDAGAWLGRFMASAKPELKHDCVKTTMYQMKTLARMKPLAFALASGINLTKIVNLEISFFPPESVRELIIATNSSHGRIALKKQEPDMEHMMTRSEHDVFFGLCDKDLRQ